MSGITSLIAHQMYTRHWSGLHLLDIKDSSQGLETKPIKRPLQRSTCTCIKLKTSYYFILNAGLRAEEFVYQKLDKPKPPRLTESEALGQSMIEAGNDFGPGTNYGEMFCHL